jgi:two-component system OmpR family sensor kinase
MLGPGTHGRDELPAELARLLHDLRGPLNSIAMHAEVLKRSTHDNAGAEESRRMLVEQAGRLSAMLPAALAIVSLEVRTAGPVDLGAVAEAAGKDAGGPVTIAGGAWPTVSGDEALLRLALRHLFANAVEAATAATAGRPPVVSAAVRNREVAVSVRDWGSGLRTTDPKLIIKLLHSTKPGHQGLGLVTVERIARLHHGRLTFKSPPDGGAQVTLHLPAS